MPECTLRFQHKLWQIVNNCRSGSVFWSESGDSVIFKLSQFKKEYLDHNVSFCKSNKIASFVRQLNLYGFRKLMKSNYSSKADLHEFQNIFFKKGRKDLLVNVTRGAIVPANWNASLRCKEDYSGKKRRRKRRHHMKRNSIYDRYEHCYGKQKRIKNRHNQQFTPIKQSLYILSDAYQKSPYHLKEYTKGVEAVNNSPTVKTTGESLIISESNSKNCLLVPTNIKMTNFSSEIPETNVNAPQKEKEHQKEMPKVTRKSDALKRRKLSSTYREMPRKFSAWPDKKSDKVPENLDKISHATLGMLQDIPGFRESKLFPFTSYKTTTDNNKHLYTVLVPKETFVSPKASVADMTRIPDEESDNNQAEKEQEETATNNSESAPITISTTENSDGEPSWAYLDDDFPWHDITDDGDEYAYGANEETFDGKNNSDLDELPEVTMNNADYSRTDCEFTTEYWGLKCVYIRQKHRVKASFCVCNPIIPPSQVLKHLGI